MTGRGESLDPLLNLDGFLAEVGGGHWVKIVARRVPSDADRPHGVSYTLTLHDSSGRRVFGIDNAHPVRLTRSPGGRSSVVRDHLHRGDSVRPYPFVDANSLVDDFWREVEAILRKEGVQ